MEYAPDLAATLALEELDRDLFRGVNTVHAQVRPSLFGGQVAAQALMAAGLTVPDERLPHSLHGYFLRPGLIDHPVVLRVDRDRDGRSFSARHVAAIQEGEVIFSMLASFQAASAENVFDDVGPMHAPTPLDCPVYGADPLLEMRQVTMTEVVDGRQLYSDCIWVRAAHRLPDDPMVHACALAYLSDLGTGFGRMTLPTIGNGGPSIDHALWFHEPMRADEWVLLDLVPWKATPGRALYRGVMRDLDGRIGASLAQEHLLRSEPVIPPANA
ncbi:MAG: acyl-CoA thioesterase domain-containing protein [Acidimicrobiia bacterium]